MSRILPARPDLEQLKAQARELQRAYNAGVGSAVERFSQHLAQAVGRHNKRGSALLAQAQTVLAREYGFASWPLLRAHVQSMRAQQPSAVLQPTSTALRSRPQQVALLAERIALAAKRHDLEALLAALQIGRRDGDAARALLVAEGHFGAVVDTLLPGAAHQNPRVRFLTAQAMDHWADARCIGQLQALLLDPTPRVRWAALHSLGCEACKLAPLAATTDLSNVLIVLACTDPSVKVRRVAAWELGQRCPTPQVLGALQSLCLEERDPVVLRNARSSLRRLGKIGAIED